MNQQILSVEMADAQLQEGLVVGIEDNALPAEQIIHEQNAEQQADGNPPAPRFLP
jgi:hypothetical protein